MPTSTAAIIATVVASIGVFSGAIMSNKNTHQSATQASIAAHAETITDHSHLHDHSVESINNHYRKPGADAALLSPNSYSLEQNAEKQMPIVLEVPPVNGVLQVEVKAESPLRINGQNLFEFQTGERRKVEFSVNLSADQDGEFPVHVFTHFVDEHGNASARAMAVAAKVGNVNSLKLHAKHQAQMLQPVEFIKLPGEETIR